ncbi:hypothetical protein DOM21_13250 [Bacteriovorax stolpii]|uniref:hypothetical protein n=1 Tax=Bacteriovorax stolpii TaxID=960 RepID=UPI0011581B14|nr:hypothetical protein [Bacteriovorax stolpii]QDK42393.1 hypothetical protein DOM21_13250 [Bacteriovorax stolpii]
MKYETFEAEFVKQNKQLRLILGVAIFLMILILFFIVTDKKYFVLKNSKLINDKPLLTWACEESFQSIANGKPEKDLIDELILNELKKSPFKVDSDEVLSVITLKENLCRIIVKGEGKVRSFIVSFKSSSNFAFYYKLTEINETELNQSEFNLTKDTK